MEPYLIQSNPIELKISKFCRKGSLAKQFELLIQDKEFTVLKQLGSNFTLIVEKQEFVPLRVSNTSVGS